MPQLKYCYKTEITFTERVHTHHFLLRILPFENEAQHIIDSHYSIFPQGKTCVGFDTFGNKIITGYIDDFHDSLTFSSEGTVETRPYKMQEPLNRLYLYPSKLTNPTQSVKDFLSWINLSEQFSVQEKVAAISNTISETLKYESGITTIQTTAAEALALRKGVCQDFTHLMISLCRLSGIASRYIAGFIEGEGFSHAWMEYYADGYWYAFDPTHNRKIETEYIKIAQGRDYSDCPIDKGQFMGITQQNLEVYLKTEKKEEQQ